MAYTTCPNGSRRRPEDTGPCACCACHHDRRGAALQDRGDYQGAQWQHTAARAHEAAERQRNAEHEAAYRRWWRKPY